MYRVVRIEKVVVQIVAAKGEAYDPYAGKDQSSKRGAELHEARRNDPLQLV